MQTSVGMLPVRSFRSSESLTKDFNFANSEGIVPERSFLLRVSSPDRCSKFVEGSRAGREREKIQTKKSAVRANKVIRFGIFIRGYQKRGRELTQ
jgi:hypothetical protein